MKLHKQDIPFTMVANEVLYRDSITLKAKGLFAYLFSKPDSWDFASDRIARECKEDRKTIQRVLRELEEAGLLSRTKHADGRVDYNIQYAESQSPKSGLRLFGEPKSQNASEAIRLGGKMGLISNTEGSSNTEVISKKEAELEFFNQAKLKERSYSDFVIELAKVDYLPPSAIHRIILTEFIPYWTEKSPAGKKQRWEMQKVFDPKRRVVTWLKIYHEKKRDYRCKLPLWHENGTRCYCFQKPVEVEESGGIPMPFELSAGIKNLSERLTLKKLI